MPAIGCVAECDAKVVNILLIRKWRGFFCSQNYPKLFKIPRRIPLVSLLRRNLINLIAIRRSCLPCTTLPYSHTAAWPRGSRHSMYRALSSDWGVLGRNTRSAFRRTPSRAMRHICKPVRKFIRKSASPYCTDYHSHHHERAPMVRWNPYK